MQIARILSTVVALSFAAPGLGQALERVPDPVAFTLAEVDLTGKLNVNTATADQWELLPGIGPATADKLVAYRSKKPFAEITHIMRVKGIGRKTFNRIKPFLTTKGDTTLASPGKR